MRLRTEHIIEAFADTLALVEDEAQREHFSRLLAATRPALERAAYELAGEVVRAVDEALGEDVRVQLSYAPDGVNVAVTRAERDEGVEALAAASEEMERLTLRLPAEVKELASGLAAEAAVSLNTWIVRSLARAVAHAAEHEAHDEARRQGRRNRRGGGRLRGRVGS